MGLAVKNHLVKDGTVYSLGVDESSVLLVDAHGIATLEQVAKNESGYVPRGAYLLVGHSAMRLAPNAPLLTTVEVIHISKSGQHFNLAAHTGDGTRATVTVDGSKTAIYSPNPY